MHLRELASYIVDLVFPPRDTAKVVERITEQELLALLRPRIRDATVALLTYSNRRVRSLIIEAKFKRNERAIDLLALVVRRYIEKYYAHEDVILVPIPLSAKRKKERGYNQVELIALKSTLPTEPLLTRTRDTAPQTSLTKAERRENLHDAFILTQKLSPNHTYILLDDVFTTGSTLSAARAACAPHTISTLALAH